MTFRSPQHHSSSVLSQPQPGRQTVKGEPKLAVLAIGEKGDNRRQGEAHGHIKAERALQLSLSTAPQSLLGANAEEGSVLTQEEKAQEPILWRSVSSWTQLSPTNYTISIKRANVSADEF